ncbi:MAG TPA: SEC-C metal-binding domain-containing protein, partial [Patescibacteria group bacterium]
ITFQNYFRLYSKLAGMTGTAATEAEEFKKIYNLDVITIPTYRTIQRIDSGDLIFKTQRSKYAAVASKIEELHQKGQPVLIGTTSIEKNQIISSLLTKKGVPHQILNAKNHRAEAEIISKAGIKGAVTVATNMAGRGVDIILGGPKDNIDPKVWKKSHDEVIGLGGLFVVGTERHESRRIDNQLRGRAGRQGDPGSSQFYVALDDDLMRIFGGEKISSIMTRFNMPDDMPLEHPLVSRVIEQIQVKVEGYNFDVRKNVVEYDDVINKQRQIVYNLRDSSLKNSKENPDKLHEDVFNYVRREIENIVNININFEDNRPDIEKIVLEFSEILPMPDSDRHRLEDKLKQTDDIADYLYNILSDQWEQRLKFFGPDIAKEILLYAVTSTMDPLWVDHLTVLDDLREGVRLRGYAQKDPLIEYRKEGFEMFQKLMRQFEYNLSRKLFRLEPAAPVAVTVPDNATETRGQIEDYVAPANNSEVQNLEKLESGSSQVNSTSIPLVKKTMGRNDPCWCGSGKKWKKCHYPELG